MDIMDIQAVESKLSDVTVTPIPRSQVQNFYNYQQQREQREQQPQIQISAIHHVPRDRLGDHNAHSHHRNNETFRDAHSIYAKRDRERDYHQKSSSTSSAAAVAAAATALQFTQLQQQLQAQLTMLQQQSNTTTTSTVSPAASIARATAAANNNNSNNNHTIDLSTDSQLKYPTQSTSPVISTMQTSANITTPMTSTASLPTTGSGSNGLSKYAQLLTVIEEMGRDIRPTYTGSRNSTERLKRGIVHARILVRECLMETERSARQ